MSWKSLEEFQNAIEVSPEEYDAYMLKTGQLRSADEQYAIEAAVDALTDGDLDYCEGC